MLAGALYDPSDPQLSAERTRCRNLCMELNATSEEETANRRRILAQLFGKEVDAWIQPPFFCDYGANIVLGDKVFFNFNCVVLDVAQVTIGSNVLFGPAVQIYTATHPMEAAARAAGRESGKPITIGADVWIGGGAIICPGVIIGDRAVIGAGSVVVHDVPPDTFVAGNPARAIRRLNNNGI